MFLDDLKSAIPSVPSPYHSEDTDPFGPASAKVWEGHGDGREDKTLTPKPLRRASTTDNKKRFSMRIPIRAQLALLVLFTSMLALAVVSIATWFYNLNFVVSIKSQGLALTASLKAAQVTSDLQLIQSTCATISTRLLIQAAIQRFYAGNNTDANWVRATTDIQSALANGGYSNLLQVKIFPRNDTGNIDGILNVTAAVSAPIALPYTYDNGSAVNLGDLGLGYPPALYPNLTYVPTIEKDPGDPSTTATDVYAFPDYKLSASQRLLLGPLQINSTFALVSLTLPIINNTSAVDVLGYMTVIADASALFSVLESREGLDTTGIVLLIGPANAENKFSTNEQSANGTNVANRTALAGASVNYVFPPIPPDGQDSRHVEHSTIGKGPAFPLSKYPAALNAYYNTNGAINNASSELSTTNEQGDNVAVGYARPQTPLADWILLVEQTHNEAWHAVTQLKKILLACVFGTIGFIMLIVVPIAHFSVLPITRLKEATMTSVAPPGYSDNGSIRSEVIEDGDVSGDEEAVRIGSATSKHKTGFIVRMRELTRGRRRKSKAEKAEDARRRAFKIPATVQDKKHYVTDELTELTATFNEMSSELTQQYSRLEERVAERTQELEISKKAAEAANESKTLFIANISHELKTPLNGILGMCAVCMGENDLDKIKKSLNVVYKSGELLLHLLNDLLTFSKNQIGQSLSLEEREFGLADIKTQLINIFDKQVKEGKINFSVKYLSTDASDALGQNDENSPPRHFGPLSHKVSGKKAPAVGPAGTGRLKDMRLWGDQHRIIQVIINLVSNSLKFTPENGEVEVRIKCIGEVEQQRNERDSRTSLNSKSGSQTRHSRARDRLGSGSNTSVGSRVPSSSAPTKPMGTALLINPMDPKAATMHIQVRERAPTPPPAHAKTYMFQFEVEDTGPGISPALQERVFEPFVQGDLGLSKKYGGTGLGLSICSQLAGLMGGTITLESTVGVGSKFKMQIPLKFVKERTSSTASSSVAGSRTPSVSHHKDDSSVHPGRRSLEVIAPGLSLSTEGPTVDDNQPRLVGLSSPFFAASPGGASKSPSDQLAALDRVVASKSPFNKIRVLVAEDNLVNQEVVLRMLKLEDIYDVTVAKDGQEAYDMVKASMDNGVMYNLIFMDIQMPNLDGLQSTRMIRSMGYAAPIVALTAFAEESNVKECMESGMDMFLSKPIRRPALKQVLKKFAPIPEETEVGTGISSQKNNTENEQDDNISPGTTPGLPGQIEPVVLNTSIQPHTPSPKKT